MLVLGIDTSCDDTSLALLEDGRRIIADVVSSQVDLHSHFGGVVPEVASRKHVELIDSLYAKMLSSAGVSAGEIDVITVTNGPGLVGSLLVGLCFAKGLSLALDKPLLGVNHVEAHAMSIFLEREVEFPFVALVVSGGHTIILHIEGPDRCKVLGTTRDDAAGEAFDKIAKYLNLGYPGGKVIEETARRGARDYVNFPRPMMDDGSYDFSFSGLKTAFMTYARGHDMTGEIQAHALACFQEAVFDVLASKVFSAALAHGVSRVVVGGGVAANGRLREVFKERGEQRGIEVMVSSPRFCTDNGAMVAVVGYDRFSRGEISDPELKVFSRMVMKQGAVRRQPAAC